MKKPALIALALVAANVSAPSNAQSSDAEQAQSGGMLEEVIVTARKREESLQEAPVAVTAISGEGLRQAGIANITELTNSVPSLQINKGQANQIFIRGVGQRASTLKVDPAVGVYVDGIFMPRSDGQFLDALDIESVQVLRGPQGTLFGKNNTGGALVFGLTKPNDTLGGSVSATLGNYGSRILNASLNVPVTDNFYTRISYSSNKDDGYVKDVGQNQTNNSNDRQALVGQMRWDASDTVVVDGLVYYGETRERFPGNNCEVLTEDALLVHGANLLYQGDTDPNNPTAYVDSCEANGREKLGDLRTNMGSHHLMDSDLDTLLAGVTLDWEISDTHSAKFILGFGDQLKGPLLESDSDAGVLSLVDNYFSDDSKRQWLSFEGQLSGSAFEDRLNYTVGGFLMVEDNTEQHMTLLTMLGIDPQHIGPLLNPSIPSLPPIPGTAPLVGSLGGPMNFLTEFDLTNTTTAAFAQASWDFSDALQLTLGVRYTEEKREAELLSVFTDLAAQSAQLRACDPRFVEIDPVTHTFGLHTFLGTWAQDPVGAAMACFPDIDGDGYFDAPLDYAGAKLDVREDIFRKVTPMASLSYVLPEDYLDGRWLSSAMTYITYSTGFKSGFFEPKGTDGLQRVEPEVVKNTELGFKIDALERSLRLNVALYSMAYEEMQLIQVSTDSSGALAIVFNNVGEAVIEGGELELTWFPSAQWMLNLSYSNNNYKFEEFLDADVFSQFLGVTQIIDRSDENLPVSPEKTASLGLQYMRETPLGTFIPRIDIAYKGEVYMGFDRGSWEVHKEDSSKAVSDAFTLVNLRFSWMSPEGDMDAALFVKNAADERYDIGAVAIGSTLGTHNRVYGAPRTYGLELRKTF